MTTTQRILVTATVTLAVIAAVYEWHRASELEMEIRALRDQQATLAGQIEQLQRKRDEASKRLALLADENTELKSDSAKQSGLRDEVAQLKAAAQVDVIQSMLKSWLERVTQLKQRLEQTPGAKIPELQFVTEQDWLDAAKREPKSEPDYRRALSAIRAAGEAKLVAQYQKALKEYARANDEQFPTDLSQLKPYFDPPMDDAILQRWIILPATAVPNFQFGGNTIITQRAPVDDVFDTRFVVGQTGGQGSIDFFWTENTETMKPVYEAYGAAHNGKSPDDSSQLVPFATTSEQRTALEKLILRESTLKDH